MQGLCVLYLQEKITMRLSITASTAIVFWYWHMIDTDIVCVLIL
jgi:hypothetical protein